MIFLKLFLVFAKIGIVSFGGGYAMLPLIQDEVVNHYHWLSVAEFTDLLAISQMTPGPIGINVATFVGYSSVIAEGYAPIWGVIGALIASFAILLLPFLLILSLAKLFYRYKSSIISQTIFAVLRPIVIGLIASAGILLMSSENFGSLSDNMLIFTSNIILCLLTVVLVYRYKVNPLKLIGGSGVFGIIFYSLIL